MPRITASTIRSGLICHGTVAAFASIASVSAGSYDEAQPARLTLTADGPGAQIRERYHDSWKSAASVQRPDGRETLRAGTLAARRSLQQPIASGPRACRDITSSAAKSVVLLYLQGGPPTQDMFDMKPAATGGVGGEFKPIASSASGIQICELLPKTARWMHKSAIVRSVHHNGGCHKNLPMYTGFDVNLPDEEFRDSDPPSMGSVCVLPRARSPSRVAEVRVSTLSARLGRSPQEGWTARRISRATLRCLFHRMHGLRRSSARRHLETASGARQAEAGACRIARGDHARPFTRSAPPGGYVGRRIPWAGSESRLRQFSARAATGVRDAHFGQGARGV